MIVTHPLVRRVTNHPNRIRAMLRAAQTKATNKYTPGGREKTGSAAPKPINLRRPQQER